MNVLIEKYRGVEIFLNTDNGWFNCILNSDEYKKFVDYIEIKKRIDEYQDKNNNFVPFWIETRIEYEYEYNKKLVVGIDKNNKFIVEENGVKTRIASNDIEADYVLFYEDNTAKRQELEKLTNEFNAIRDEYKAKYNNIYNGMRIVRLSDIKDNYKESK